MFTIRIIDHRDGKPYENQKVCVHYSGILGGTTKTIRTDSRGEATFDYRNGRGKVYVGSTVVHEGEIAGYMTFYV